MIEQQKNKPSGKDGLAILNADIGNFNVDDSECQEVEVLIGYGKFATPKTPKEIFTMEDGELVLANNIQTRSLRAILAMVDDPQCVSKDDAMWVIPSAVVSRSHHEQEVQGRFHALWFDLDDHPPSLDYVLSVVLETFGDVNLVLYNSRSASSENQKCRGIIPLAKPIGGREFVICQKMLNRTFVNAGIASDTSSERAGQVCYLPNRGAFYRSITHLERDYFDPLQFWGQAIAQAIEEEESREYKAIPPSPEAIENAKAVLDVIKALGLYKKDLGQGLHDITCPWVDLHTDAKDSGTAYFEPSHENNNVGGFSCRHAHCVDKRIGHLLTYIEAKLGKRNLLSGDARSDFADSINVNLNLNESANKPRKFIPELIPPVKMIKATQFVYDGFMASGVVVLAAAPGTGKTTAEVGLAMRVTGLITDDGFEVGIKRKVIIFTEHSTQIEEIITAMLSDSSCESTYKEVREKIILINAKRMKSYEIKDCADFIEKGSFETENARGTKRYMAKPFVIFDTTNANFEIENENDSQQMGGLIASIKTEFFLKREIPTLLVTHTAKTLKYGDADSLSARGSSAIEGDAHQIIYLTTGKNNSSRFLELGKHRFTAKTLAIKLNSDMRLVHALDHFNELISYPVTYISKLEPITKEERDLERTKAAEIAKDTRVRESENAIRCEVLDALERWPRLSQALTDAVIPTKEQIINKASKARKMVAEVFEALVVEGHIVADVMCAEKRGKFKKISGKTVHNSQQTFYWLANREGGYFD